ncbi:MAG: NAD(P)H-dependent oxidoreductase [Aureispira sp.]|nr:NAD(P)H-dependent oxidoreductase [Aureispira sp.]
MKKLNILGINGSASSNSSNLTVLKMIANFGEDKFNLTILDDLTILPHFKPELTNKGTPQSIIELRNQIKNSDGIIISTPEYIFSIPSGLKNLIEWCVSETIFSDKPTGLITASASGEKGHEELKLIMKTIQTHFTNDTTLLIQGIKGKTNKNGDLIDSKTKKELEQLTESFIQLIETS